MDNGPGRTALTPLAFLKRSAEVFPGKTAYAFGDRRATYEEFAAETTRLANALRASGVGPGDRVAYLAPNIPELLIAHFAVPLAGAVLVAINTRLAPEEIRYILDHSGAKALVVDAGLHPSVAPLAGALPEVVTCPGRRRRSRPGGRRRRLRRPAGARLGRPAAVGRGRRGRRHFDQLHVRHHGTAEGRRLHAPRRLPERARRGDALAAHAATASTCGRCRCSTATGGAPRGRSPRSAGRRCACARSSPPRCGGSSTPRASRTSTARRPCWWRSRTRRRRIRWSGP